MKRLGTIAVGHKQRDPAIPLEMPQYTDAEMEAAELAYPDSPPLPKAGESWAGLTRLVNVKHLRERLGLTQEEFARIYWIPLGTLRDWEQRRKKADRAAQAYLKVIEGEPAVVAELLTK